MTDLNEMMLKQIFPFCVVLLVGFQIDPWLDEWSKNREILWAFIASPIWISLFYGTRWLFVKLGWLDEWIR